MEAFGSPFYDSCYHPGAIFVVAVDGGEDIFFKAAAADHDHTVNDNPNPSSSGGGGGEGGGKAILLGSKFDGVVLAYQYPRE